MKTITPRLLPLVAACLSVPVFAQNTSHDPGGVPTPAGTSNENASASGSIPLTTAQFAKATSNGEEDQTGGESRMRSRENDNARRTKGAMEEVIVTAQKREERLQDVPISISMLRGQDLDAFSAKDVTEVLSGVPGVVIVPDGQGGNSQVAIRGVAAEGGVSLGSSPTAYYLDSVPFAFVKSAFAPSADAYDLERVEVLRGPQGTLYGANALNGVVRVLSHDADLDKLEFKARGLSSNTNDGDWNYRADAAVNVPIVEDKLALRAVLGYQDLSGWLDKPSRAGYNDTERRSGRLKLNAKPVEQLSIGMSAWYSDDDAGGPDLANADGQRLYPADDEQISTKYEAYNLEVGYAFHSLSVTSRTSYIDYENSYNLGLAVLAPNSLLSLPVVLTARTFAQEIAFGSTGAGPWRWTAGAMYRDSKDTSSFSLPPIFFSPARDEDFSESYAIFGELTRSFMEGRWELTLGARYFEDDVQKREIARNETNPDTGPLIVRGDTFDATTPRVVLTWHPNEDLNLYASYSQGFRSGWPQAPTSPLPDVGPDKLTNYELGSKGNLMAGRLAFDAALYYMDWKDIQQTVNVVVPGTNFCCTSGGVNGDSASGIGVDLGVTLMPVGALRLGVDVSWNDLTMDAPTYTNGGTVVLFEKGDRPNRSSEYTLGAFADYQFPIGTDRYEGQFAISGAYTSPQPFRSAPGGILQVAEGDAIATARASFSLHAADRWTATLFVDNLTDERGAVARTSMTPSINDEIRPTRPRTIGVQVEYHYSAE